MINEIEFNKKTINFSVFDVNTDFASTLEDLELGEKFNLEDEIQGLHDQDNSDSIARGFYSYIQPYETENIVDGVTQQVIMKRIKTCEYMLDDDMLFAWGDSGAIKALSTLAVDTNKVTFEFNDLYNLQSRMSLVKSLGLKNPKGKDLKNITLSGCIDCYAEYQIVEPNNHDITKVSGKLDTSMGEVVLNVTKQGAVRITAQVGLVINFQCLKDLIGLIYGKETV